MRKLESTIVALAAAAMLAACGGGGGSAGTSPFGNGSGSGTGTGTGGTSTAQADSLAMTLSKSGLVNAGGDTLTVAVQAKDANGVTLAGVPVSFKVDSDASITPMSTQTDSSGQLTAVVSAGSNRANRAITVTATSGGKSVSQTFLVTGSKLSAQSIPLLAPSTSTTLTYTLLDNTSNPMADMPITVSVDGQKLAEGKTDPQGKFDFALTAPASAATINVVAEAAGVTSAQSIVVQSPSVGSVPVAVGPIQSASVQIASTVLSVNAAGSTAKQTEVRALVYGAGNKPIPNVRVRFAIDPSTNSDATVSVPGNATYAYTDSNGVARGTLIAGQIGSPTDGVRVYACYAVNDFAPETCLTTAAKVSATLTITNEALAITIGTNNVLAVGGEGLTYIKRFVVMATDAAGGARSGVTITPSLDLTRFYKGQYTWDTSVWVQNVSLDSTQAWDWLNGAWTQIPVPWGPVVVRGTATTPAYVTNGAQPFCPNEDANRNAVLEAGEDLNGNGSLDPRKASVSVSPQSVVTDAQGLAIVQIEYPKNFAEWVDYRLKVTAKVGGTESVDYYVGDRYGNGSLPVLAEDVRNENVAPAGWRSPFGVDASCQSKL